MVRVALSNMHLAGQLRVVGTCPSPHGRRDRAVYGFVAQKLESAAAALGCAMLAWR